MPKIFKYSFASNKSYLGKLVQNPLFDLVVIFLAALIINISWFHEGLLYGGGEEGLSFYDSSLTLKTISSIWQDYSLGTPSIYQINKIPLYYFASILTQLHFSGGQIQALIHLILFLTGMISVYFLLKTTISRDFNFRYLALFGALFYFLNPFSMSQVWTRGLYMQFIPFAFFPLTLLLLNLSLQKNKQSFSLNKIYLVFLALLVSFIFSAGFSPAYVLTYWLMIALLFGFHLWHERKDVKSLLRILLLGLVFLSGWLILNSWWLVQYFLFSNTLYLSNETVTNESVGTLMAVSKYSGLFNVLRLLQEGYFGSAWLYGNFVQTLTFKILSWMIPLLALFSLSQIKNSRWLKMYSIFFVFSLFICLGANLPFGPIFVWLFTKFSFLQLYRNPYEKFGIVLMLSYTPFVSIGFCYLVNFLTKNYSKYKSLIISFVIVTIFGILVWPMWTGVAVRTISNQNFVAVPSYYKELNSWFDKNNSSKNRVLMLPFMPGPGATMTWGNKVYSGVDPSLNILDYSVLSWSEGFPFANDLLVTFYKSIGKADVIPAFGLLRAKYMVIRGDMQNVEPRDLRQEQNILSSFYSPNNLELDMPSFCINQKQVRDQAGPILFSCGVSESLKNFEKYRYLHLTIKTDKPSSLDISLRDGDNRRPRWDGTASKEYRTNSSDWTNLTLTLDLPVYGDSAFNSSNVKLLEIAVHPNPPSDTSQQVNQIEISKASLDEGQEHKTDYYSFITQFDKLRLYELKKYQDFKEVTILSEVKQIEGVEQLIEDSAKLNPIDGTTGYVLSKQNPKFNLEDNFSSEGDVQPLSSYLYRVSFPDNNLHYLVLHKTFNPMWKIIPNIQSNDLKSDLLSEIKLVKKFYLPETNHFIVNGYGNLWQIQNRGDLAIVFLPQITFDILFKISLIALIPTLIFAVLPLINIHSFSSNKR